MSAVQDRIIGRLSEDERRELLDVIAQRHPLVMVERSYNRKLDEADRIVGTIVGVAYSYGGGSAIMLILQPLDPSKRMVAIPSAHLCRIRAASGWGPNAPELHRYKVRLGEVLAGPPLRDRGAE